MRRIEILEAIAIFNLLLVLLLHTMKAKLNAFSHSPWLLSTVLFGSYTPDSLNKGKIGNSGAQKILGADKAMFI